MLQRTLIAALLFSLLTCTIAFWDHIHLRPTDLDDYQRFIIEGAPQRSRHALQSSPATQARTQVQKDFWIPQGTARNHLRIISETSELVLSERGGKIEATEKLHNMEGWMYEELQANHQQVRHFTAKKGTYYYPSHRFFSQDVTLHLFRNPDTDLHPSTAFLHGTAAEASFSACGATSTFKAEKLKANFTPQSGGAP
jgi:hypothetical protein